MNTSPKIYRAYNLGDAKLLSFCMVIQLNLVDNISDFEAFDSRYTLSFANNFKDQINAALAMETDNQLIDAQAQASMDVQQKMDECCNTFQLLKYFILKAFENSAGIRSEFGFGNYAKARINADALIQFMTDVHQTVLKYEAELLEVGYGSASIAQLLAIKNELQTLNTLKGQTKGTRYSGTHQRIEAYNALWKTCNQICRAGKIIYNNNYGKYQLFLVPWPLRKKGVKPPEPIAPVN